MEFIDLKTTAASIADWYAKHKRDLPWRQGKDPYRIWISEIMLQQTRIEAVIPYYGRFLSELPDVAALAAVPEDRLLKLWEGLGYYSRARNLKKAAQTVVQEFGGQMPQTAAELRILPGIGEYTAGAIASIAFGEPEPAVDGNVMRVIARLRGMTQEITAPDIYPLAQKLTSPIHGADYASAIMDLGATVCTPTNPKCALCPWAEVCIANKKGIQEQIPQIKKLIKKEKFGRLYLIQNPKGEYLIRKRSGKGLLSGLWEFPWEEVPELSSKKLPHVVHVFTHFKLTLELVQAPEKATDFPDGVWVIPKDFKNYPFSTLMQKVIRKL